MVKLVAMFKEPADAISFEEHYEAVHLPLVRKMPGVRRIEVSRVTGAPMSKPQFYRMAEYQNNEFIKSRLGGLLGQ